MQVGMGSGGMMAWEPQLGVLKDSKAKDIFYAGQRLNASSKIAVFNGCRPGNK